ncbi:MAG TPA: histidine ammonia-lyase, partial [Pseudohongiella sp.]|nr:histidine ammonia-lyase [Pseudohongiella sp.]
MIIFGDSRLTIEDVAVVARQQQSVALSQAPEFRRRIAAGVEFLDRLLAEEGVIYGVTTGYGDSCTVSIPAALVEELPRHLYTFHGCGLGENLSAELGRAVLAARLVSLCQGYSGVREV